MGWYLEILIIYINYFKILFFFILIICKGKSEIETSNDFYDANPYKLANGMHYTSKFQRAICLSREGNFYFLFDILYFLFNIFIYFIYLIFLYIIYIKI